MRSAVIVTGASQGYGRSLVMAFANNIPEGDIDFYLMARNEDGLKQTESELRKAWDAKKVTNRAVGSFLMTVDLSNPTDYTVKIDAVISQLKAGNYDRLYLVHNAGSLGELGYAQEVSSPEAISSYMELNVNSLIWFNKCFIEVFGASREELDNKTPPETDQRSLIINITSLCAIEPFVTQQLYCLGKAARDMHVRVIAGEQEPSPKLRLLSYSPGPMDTDMHVTMRGSDKLRKDLNEMFNSLKTEDKLVKTDESARRGVCLALSGKFESGAHIDYFGKVFAYY